MGGIVGKRMLGTIAVIVAFALGFGVLVEEAEEMRTDEMVKQTVPMPNAPEMEQPKPDFST